MRQLQLVTVKDLDICMANIEVVFELDLGLSSHWIVPRSCDWPIHMRYDCHNLLEIKFSIGRVSC